MYSTKETTNKDSIVVEMKAEKTEKSVLLKGVNGNNKPPSDHVTIETVGTTHFIGLPLKGLLLAGYFQLADCLSKSDTLVPAPHTLPLNF